MTFRQWTVTKNKHISNKHIDMKYIYTNYFIINDKTNRKIMKKKECKGVPHHLAYDKFRFYSSVSNPHGPKSVNLTETKCKIARERPG